MKQKIIIVDENDFLLDFKYREEVDFSTDIYRCSAVWLENSHDKVLLAQRKLTKDKDPGKWGPAAAGTLEEDETYESNAYKELEEELGVVGVALEAGPKLYHETTSKCFAQWFYCNLDKPVEQFHLQEDEVEQIVWIDKDALRIDVVQNPDKYLAGFSGVIDCLLSKNKAS